MRLKKTGKLIAGLTAFGVLMCFSVPLLAQENITNGPKRLTDYDLPGLDTKVYLNTMIPWDVVQLIEFLAHKGGLNNIVIGKGVAGLTTKLKFHDVTVGDALEIVLSVNNLAYEVKGGIVTIMKDTEYAAARGRSFYDQKQVRVIDLKYADPTHVAKMLEPIKSTIGFVVADQVTGTLILIDTPANIGEMQAIISKADIPTLTRVLPTETKTFALQYASIDDIHPQVGELLTDGVGSVRADRRTKTLIVTDLPHGMKKVEQLIEVFDRRPKQVFIEAKIVEISLDDRFSLGINWSQFFEGLDPRFSLSAVSGPAEVAERTAMLTYNTIVAGEDLQIVLEALKEIADTKILSNPQIAVVDGQEAMIEVVDNQPYKEIQLETGTTNVTGVTYLFEKVGVQLAVTPRINDEDIISVLVKPEISSIANWYDGPPQESTPVIRKALAETSVMVKNGVTVIIGGLIVDRKDSSVRKVPIFGSLPVIGRLFRYDTVVNTDSEIVVFLTPRIVSGDEPFLRDRDMKKRAKPLRAVGLGERKNLKPVR